MLVSLSLHFSALENISYCIFARLKSADQIRFCHFKVSYITKVLPAKNEIHNVTFLSYKQLFTCILYMKRCNSQSCNIYVTNIYNK